MFRIDWIKDIQLTNKTFQVPSDFSLASYMGKSWQKEEMLHPTQKINPSDNGAIIFSAEVPSFIEIKKWVLRLGSCAKVLMYDLRKEILQVNDYILTVVL